MLQDLMRFIGKQGLKHGGNIISIKVKNGLI